MRRYEGKMSFWVFTHCHDNFHLRSERELINHILSKHQWSDQENGKFHHIQPKNHYRAPEDPVKVSGKGKGFFLRQTPAPCRLPYAWESRRPALLICVIQDGGGFVMFPSTQKWSFLRPCQIIPQTQGRTSFLNPSACGGNKEQL